MSKKATMFDFGWGPVPAHQHPNGSGWVADTAYVEGTAYVGPKALVFGSAQVFGSALVYGSAQVYGLALVCDAARVYGSALVCDSALVCGSALVYGSARVCGSALVSSPRHVLSIPQVGEHGLTLFRSDPAITSGHQLQAGCELTTVPDALARLTKPKKIWPDATPEQCRHYKRQWKAALTLCALRIEEWEEGQ